MNTLEHLEEALDHLESAKEEAGLGTRMMIGPIILELADLIERTRNIDEDQ